MRIYLPALLSLFLHACSQPTATPVQHVTPQSPAFDTFMAQYPERTLPVVLTPCPSSSELNDRTHIKPMDSAIGAPFGISSGSLIYGRIRTNGDYQAVISLGLADCLAVMLNTYDENGKLIDSQYLQGHDCGGDGPGWSCEEHVRLDTDYTITIADSAVAQEVDSNYMPIAGGKIFCYVATKKGRLRSDGHIEIGPERRDTLRMAIDTASASAKK